jgi:hypothetical protein
VSLRFLFLIYCCLFSFESFAQDSLKDTLYPYRSKENGKIGYVNQKQEVIIPGQYASGTYFDEKPYAVVTLKNDSTELFAVIDTKGHYLISFDSGYELISLENNFKDWILVVKNGKWGYISTSKEMIIPMIYDHLGDFYGGLAHAKKDGKYGFIDSNNVVIIDFQFQWTMPFGSLQPDSFRYAEVEKDGKHGFINNQGKLVVPYIYDFAYPFHDGVAIVKKGDKYGCINTQGQLIVPFNYAIIQDEDDRLIARKSLMSDKEFYFDRSGKMMGTGKRK